MARRINEDIRFYLPADPYYYQVDNLPLEDLLANDVRLQGQIDEINSAERGNTVGRAGFTELQPFIDAALPGTVSVRPGNFIGRAQRTSGGDPAPGGDELNRLNNGQWEVQDPPTKFGTGGTPGNPTGTYNVENPGFTSSPGHYVGRNAVFNFKGGNITIDSFGFDEFENGANGDATPPLGRIDLIGITTVNGAMDDPSLPGNPQGDGVIVGDGYPKLAVVKGAGMTTKNNTGRRQVVIGERYITIGTPQEEINGYGRDIEGNVVPNPEFGTVPMPDDVVNVNFARDILTNGEIEQTLTEFGYSNKNGSFFLPIAYVFVPQSHVEGNPIPQQYLKDIRPFFRTAELTLAERQAAAGALNPSIHNPFVTEEHAKALTGPAVTDLEQEISDLKNILRSTKVQKEHLFDDKRITNINGLTGSKGWTKVTPSQMGFSFGVIPENTVAVIVYFFGFISTPDHGDVITYVYAADWNPNTGTNSGGFHGKVLAGRASGQEDAVANSNQAVVDVDADGNFWFRIDSPGFNGALYADIQGYITETPILD